MKQFYMRDSLISSLEKFSIKNKNIYFLSGDFGAPSLDSYRKNCKNFLNMGIAEQNLINFACGLALENKIVFGYTISNFISMRCFEQIRTNISIMSEYYDLNINLVGVGAGLSYDISGPSHHGIEDINIIHSLPNIEVITPCDSIFCNKLVAYMIQNRRPKYIRLDSKPVTNIYSASKKINFSDGFSIFKKSSSTCAIGNGYSITLINNFIKGINRSDISIIDLFNSNFFNEKKLVKALQGFKKIILVQENFENSGGLDSKLIYLKEKYGLKFKFKSLSLNHKYTTDVGDRDYLLNKNGINISKFEKVLYE